MSPLAQKKKKPVIFTEGDVVDRYTVYYELGHGKQFYTKCASWEVSLFLFYFSVV